MSVLMILSFCLAALAVLLMPFYCKLTYAGKNQITLTLKMILSATFVLTAIFALCSGEGRMPYMIVMLCGFFVSFCGDFLLGKSDRMRMFVIGSCGFAVAHILYIIAFSLASKTLFYGQIHWFNRVEIGIYLALVSVILLILLVKHPPFHKLFIPMYAYYFILALMVTKAWGLGVRLMPTHPSMVLLPIGSTLFLCSDYMLGMMRFKMHERTVFFKTFCTVSYFVAQTLLAFSLYTFVKL